MCISLLEKALLWEMFSNRQITKKRTNPSPKEFFRGLQQLIKRGPALLPLTINRQLVEYMSKLALVVNLPSSSKKASINGELQGNFLNKFSAIPKK